MLTVKQKNGVSEIKKWYNQQYQQIYKLAGYAGTGKTFLTKYAISEMKLKNNEVAMCTFTGKASLVLMKHNDSFSRISTVHRLVYDFEDDRDGNITFKLKKELYGIKLILLDEASMINLDLLDALKSFGILILAIGDHGQLEGIGKQANLMKDPDFVLDEIMRQAEGSAIIHLSMLVREGKKIDLGSYGDDVYVISKRDKKANATLMSRADQVLCGYNKTRERFNAEIREIKGMHGNLPMFGDKVICLENNWKKEVEGFNFVNGMMGYIVNEPVKMRHAETKVDVMKISMQPDFLSGVFEDLYIPVGDFLGEEVILSPKQRKPLDRMTYGYVTTVNKAQGSQFPNVFLWDEPFGEDPWRHTYTGITRAEKKLILAI
jgi:exodeoxyribonuclease-5